jgi:hypothetical protein
MQRKAPWTDFHSSDAARVNHAEGPALSSPAFPLPWRRLFMTMAQHVGRGAGRIMAQLRRAGSAWAAMSSNATTAARGASATTSVSRADPVIGSWQRLDRALVSTAGPAHHCEGRLRSAISLLDGWNAPRGRCGGTIDSTVSSFPVGSSRM